jgi:H+/Cl- antiporter ClcA
VGVVRDPNATARQQAYAWLRTNLHRGSQELRQLLGRFVQQDDLRSMLLLSGCIGVGGALVSVAFREAVRALEYTYTRSPGSLVNAAQHLPWWARILVPTVGGALAGAVLMLGRRWAERRPTDYMYAVAAGTGRLSVRGSLVRSGSSVISIASGSSIGREGSMIQLSALVGSRVGSGLRLSQPRRRLAVACGAAAGVASAYNAPIGGALFVAEIVLGSIAMESFGPLIVASVVASVTIHSFLGYAPVYQIPPLSYGSNWQLGLYAALGLVLGLLAPALLELMRRAEREFERLGPPGVLRLGLGGLIVGLLSVWTPGVWGNGYGEVSLILHYGIAGVVLATLLLTKILATVASVGSGAVGGVFTPTLFVGAAAGALFGELARAATGIETLEPAAYAVVGMGALLAATIHAPLTAILMVFEMTQDYRITLPLMLAAVVAHYVARFYRHGESVYALSFADVRASSQAREATESLAGLIKSEDALAAGAPGVDGRWVVDRAGFLVGRWQGGELAAPGCTLYRDQSFDAALGEFLRTEAAVLPVVADELEPRFLGTVSRQDLLLALQEHLAAVRSNA